MVPAQIPWRVRLTAVVENCAVGVLTEARCISGKEYSGLQSHLTHVGDGQVLLGGAEGGVNCEHCSVLVTNLLDTHWEWQEIRKERVMHGLPSFVPLWTAKLRSTWPTRVLLLWY